jgi:hypothetical protein
VITLLMTLHLVGATVTLDISKLYNISTIKECQELLPIVKWNYEAISGYCWRGDILKPTKKI